MQMDKIHNKLVEFTELVNARMAMKCINEHPDLLAITQPVDKKILTVAKELRALIKKDSLWADEQDAE